MQMARKYTMSSDRNQLTIPQCIAHGFPVVRVVKSFTHVGPAAREAPASAVNERKAKGIFS